MSDIQYPTDSKEKNTKEPQHSRRFRTGLLLLGSAVFGGVAVALWNRRTLAKMQENTDEKSKKLQQTDEDAIY